MQGMIRFKNYVHDVRAQNVFGEYKAYSFILRLKRDPHLL